MARPAPRRPLWSRLLALVRAAKELLDFVPAAWLAFVVGLLGALAGGLLAWAERQPKHVVFQTAVVGFAGLAFGAWLLLAIYRRVYLMRLCRAIDAFIEDGARIHRALHTEVHRANLPGHLRELEDWRAAMQRRVLRDLRAQPYRDRLTDKDPTRDRIAVPLAALRDLRAELQTSLLGGATAPRSR